MDNHTFCRLYLQAQRDSAPKQAVEALKGAHVDRSDNYYWVNDRNNKLLWEGSAHCKKDARAKALESLSNRYGYTRKELKAIFNKLIDQSPVDKVTEAFNRLSTDTDYGKVEMIYHGKEHDTPRWHFI